MKEAITQEPYFSKNINCPPEPEEHEPTHNETELPSIRGTNATLLLQGSDGVRTEERELDQGKQKEANSKAEESIFKTISEERLRQLIQKVNNAHNQYCSTPIPTVVLRHPNCEPLFEPNKGYVQCIWYCFKASEVN